MRSSESKVKKKQYKKCCVIGCKMKSCDDSKVYLHNFPKADKRVVGREDFFGNQEKLDILKAWKIALKIENVNGGTYVCSLHFKKDDYVLPDIPTRRHHLKRSVVPSCNLPTTSREKIKAGRSLELLKRRQERSQKKEIAEQERIKKKIADEVSIEESIMETIVETKQIPEEFKDCQEPVTSEASVEPQADTSEPKKVVSTGEEQELSFIKAMKTDAELSTCTGIESFKVLETIITLVKHVYGDRFESENMKLKTKARIILVYTKLKQNLSYSFMSVIFNVHKAKHVQGIFEEMIQVLSSVLIAAIPWPSREEIRSNLPKCFSGFEDTRIVLDCTEVYIQNPKEICCQVSTYSYYKSHVTAKIMTGVAPSGTITFVSRVYGGRTSNSVIFQQSDLVDKLEPGDAVMVDQGFLIDELCETNRWKLIRPPFINKKKQFSKEDSLLTCKIASARVHVDRSNQRIKAFKIVGSVLPNNLLVLLEEILTVICATINMSSPIMKDDKFMEK